MKFRMIWLAGLMWGVVVNVHAQNNNARGAFSIWPDTGQTLCYNSDGGVIACPAEGQPFHGQDAQYHGPARSYTSLGDGTMVRDNVNGLIWEVKQNRDGNMDYDNPHDADNRYTWCDTNPATNGGNQGACGTTDTEDFINALNNQNYGGYSDWRLPTSNELVTLVDYSTYNPAINTVLFPNTNIVSSGIGYWSSTTRVANITQAWGTQFFYGRYGYYSKSDNNHVRAVRGGLLPNQNRFIENGDGTVTDTVTGLMWQQASADTNGGDPDTMNWENALLYCENLSLAGKSDWRLPNIHELYTIVDYSTYNPAIDTIVFPDTEVYDYWSSTTVASHGSSAFHVSFANGGGRSYGKGGNRYVRAVRGEQVWSFTPEGYLGQISQTPLHGPAGTVFTQSGSGFTPNSTVTLHFRNHLGEPLTPQQLPTDVNGDFLNMHASPVDKPVGTHTWWAVDDTTGRRSALLQYQIDGLVGPQNDLTVAPPPTSIPPADHEGTFGTLTNWVIGSSNFDLNKDTFVIVHGWNTDDDETLLPTWVRQMGISITNDDNSPTKDSNVFLWNWQKEAVTNLYYDLDDNWDFTDEIQSCLGVPFDKVPQSGINLAQALKVAIPEGYSNNIHLIGHSLGSGVVTHAAQYAREEDYFFADKINHLVFLDSPWLFDRPAGTFLEDTKDEIFVDNYWSQLGKMTGYKEADTNVWLPKGTISPTGHAYSHKWYRSSVTNFSNPYILGDSSIPDNTQPYGFYWWDIAHQTNVGPWQKQSRARLSPHWEVSEIAIIKEVVGYVVDTAVYTGEIAVKTGQAIVDQAQRAKKKVTLLAVNTFNTIGDLVNMTVDQIEHAKHQEFSCSPSIPCGYLVVTHASEALVTTTVSIPADTNMLTFAYEFQYAPSGSTLELLIEDLVVYRALSHEKNGVGYQMASWIDVTQVAGQEVALTFRLSHPDDNTEGAVKIDDLIFARVDDVDTDGDLIPDLAENWVSCYDPDDADGDDDGLADGVEDANQNGQRDEGETDPCNIDTDGDGIQDGTELGVTFGVPDPDEEGPLLGTDTTIFQPDLDPDSITDPLNDDTDGDGKKDGEEDLNRNGRMDPGEKDPNKKDQEGIFFPIKSKDGKVTIIYLE